MKAIVEKMQGGFSEAQEGATLALALYERVETNDFSLAYVHDLEQLVNLFPNAVETFYFLALLALKQGENKRACTLLEMAWEKRKLQHEILLAFSFLKRIHVWDTDNPWLQYLLAKNENLNETNLQKTGLGENSGKYYDVPPWIAPFTSLGGVGEQAKVMPAFYHPLPYGIKENCPPYRAGIYNGLGLMRRSYMVAKALSRADVEKKSANYAGMDFDVMRMAEARSITLYAKDTPFVVYLLGSEDMQDVHVQEEDKTPLDICPQGFEPRPIRFEKKVQLTSDKPFSISAPVFLRHQKGCRRLVLNILADGLSWAKQKQLNYADVPCICHFFQDGIIFDDNFSVAEYTYPSLASIETGMHMHHSQIFHHDRYMELSQQYRTLSEQMANLGYYPVALMADPELLTNGVGRGYARMVVNVGTEMHIAPAVDRLLRHLDAFAETDNFVFLHICDTHPYADNVQPLEYSMTHYPLESFRGNEGKASVFLSAHPMAREANRKHIRRTDRFLEVLFAYVQAHYNKEEVMINLYSDHGTAVYDEDWLLADNHVGAALMCYGGGVPALGHVNELTSNLDLYKIMGHVLGFPADMNYLDGELPKVFGGRGHEYVISNSIYHGQTYKLAIHTKRHEFRLETKALTQEDGSVDMRDFNYHMFDRKTHEAVADRALADYFLEIAKRHTNPFWKLLD